MYAAASNQVTATVTETVKAANGNQVLATRQTKRTHNVLGELVSTTEGAEQTGDDAGNQVETRYAYDGAGRLETVTTGDQTTTFAYDAAGNRASVANPNLGATLTAGDGTVSVKFAYNGGELTEREDARGATHYVLRQAGAAHMRGGPRRHGDLGVRPGQRHGAARAPRLRPGHGPDGPRVVRVRRRLRGDVRVQHGRSAGDGDDGDHRRPGRAPTTLTRSHTYDAYGRLSSTTYPLAVTVEHEYNDRGYLCETDARRPRSW